MFNSVLIPVDLSIPEETKILLNAAKDLTDPWNSKVHVASVIPDAGMAIVGSYLGSGFENEAHQRAEGELRQAVESAGLSALTHILSGTVYDKVIHLANTLEVDLIMVGAHQPELKDYLLGSNAARLVRHSQKSVLVLRH
ncbi:universal stress protein [Thalassococcus sp. S3]|uniref:universal stress protein n=1 Tax=Thalassococcus sp. S3 TaxID=2017482 RepID=UPI00102453D3|nr:universal stress protein [Thalassococcus sp. S3]QBF33911.1 universal stress protein UspA [Thalassococcus sp. S3]